MSRLLPALLLLPAVGCGPPPVAPLPPPGGALQVAFLDVGQGDAALVRTPGGAAVLIDGGPPEAGREVVALLQRAGVRRLDWVVGSHPHADHIGGLPDVLESIPVAAVLDPGYNHGTALQREYLLLLQREDVRTERARAGRRIDLDSGAALEILAPEQPLLRGTESDANNNSIVARLVFGRTRFLFTGDLEAAGRRRLLASASERQLAAQVLKVAHHGSRDGTDEVLLAAVRPEHAVISCGRGNEYGHPHPETLDALRSRGCRIHRTDEQGTIVFASDGERVRPARGAAAAGEPLRSGLSARRVGNRSTRVYHAPDCGSLPATARRVEFASAAEADRAGYRPHEACLR